MGRFGLVLLGIALFLAFAESAAASTTFGPDLSTGPSGELLNCAELNATVTSGSPGNTAISDQCNTVLTASASPADGVLVGLKIRMSKAGAGHVRILENVSGTLTYRGLSSNVSFPGDGAVHTIPLRVPISAGNLIAFGTSLKAPIRFVSGANTRLVTDTNEGSTPPELEIGSAAANSIQASFDGIVEPDTDHDGFGDESQDQCPGVKGSSNGCPAHSLTVSKSGAGSGAVVSADAFINCGSTCSHAYQSGSSVTLTAAPASGSTFAGWSGGGCSGTGACTTSLTSDQAVTADFEPVPNYTLTVAKGGTGIGFVTSADSQVNCGAACSHAYPSGSGVVLTATAGAGSVFAGWSGGGCSGTGACATTLMADQTVIATFEPVVVPKPPNTSLVSARVKGKKHLAVFKFQSSGEATGFQCALVKRHKKPSFSSCKSPKTYKRLKAGGYTFEARAVGPGGPDPSPFKFGFQIPK